MSDPIRYNVKCGEGGYEIVVSLGGEWVHYSDYARLKAEVERLTDLITRGASTPDAKPHD
jgi:hypothetical protein